MSRTQKIIFCVVGLLGAVAIIIGGMVLSSDDDKTPDETDPPAISDTNDETSAPVVPDIRPNTNDDKEQHQDRPGDIHIDIEEKGEESTRNEDPVVEGEVVIIPGVKEDD
jgi:hypothetical protein